MTARAQAVRVHPRHAARPVSLPTLGEPVQPVRLLPEMDAGLTRREWQAEWQTVALCVAGVLLLAVGWWMGGYA